ncbi:competence type IV pilus minor pilin ComGF [Pseudalkalibacillus sp. Hm43]|uniref:competence type IV pilus minor pilin ComGF n=1 Tax=Pseudalkalibacillus sp. Hm43 TaxID=3450742 RepID=UPI003F42E2BF
MTGRNQYAVKLDEQGITMLETVLSLILFLAFVSLVPSMYQLIFSTDGTSLHRQEVNLFFEQADKEIQGSTDAEISSNKLYLTQPSGKLITYEKNGNRVIRKVDGRGFEIILQRIEAIDFSLLHTVVSITVEANGQRFTHKSILVQSFLNQ